MLWRSVFPLATPDRDKNQKIMIKEDHIREALQNKHQLYDKNWRLSLRHNIKRLLKVFAAPTLTQHFIGCP